MEEKKYAIAKILQEIIPQNFSLEEIVEKIEVPKDKENGNFAYPCFVLAKALKKSPMIIANELKEQIKIENEIARVEVAGGYLNFYLNEEQVAKQVLTQILEENKQYGSSQEGKGQNVIIDYSSPNIAKPFHLGHLRNTVIGSALYHLHEALGYHVTGLNYLGDWGRQFGLIIEGYHRFQGEYDLENDPLKALSDIYVRINQLAKQDETIMDKARENFKKIEEGDEESIRLWNFFKEISLKEYNRIYEILGCHFDSYNGEAFYHDKTQEVVDILEQKHVLKLSEGAKVVEVGQGMPPCMIVKSNGSSIYATRDLASILYRARTYDFTKAIYITAYEQILHFKQIFEVAKYLVDEKYQKGLQHVYYGMVRLKTGKMSTREGNVIYVNDLIEEAIKKAYLAIENKNPMLENKELVAKQVGVGALIFNNLKTSKAKDVIFDLDEMLRFDGETGPYVQYTYVRAKSVLEKANMDITKLKDNMDVSLLNKTQEIELIKVLGTFPGILKKMAKECEPAILARFLIEVATLFSRFYNECPILSENESLKVARLALVYAVSIVIEKGLQILGMECPDKM